MAGPTPAHLPEPAPAEDQYFRSHSPPQDLDQHTATVRSFVDYHVAQGRRVVLITSGGTTVPLEKQTVRFIDNFSAGTRGATSAEYFLAHGYAVIFLHRRFSLQPYSRHYSHSTNCFLDFLSEAPSPAGSASVVASPEHAAGMLQVLRQYTAVKRHNTLCMLPFVSISEYLYMLRAIAQLMRPLGASGLMYLAAAVSDFFVPPDRMAEHKIQSTNIAASAGVPKTISPGAPGLLINLDPVPKFLRTLVESWAQGCMIVSFKLETDPALLLAKGQAALARYQHHLVIGNLLATRKYEVVFLAPGAAEEWVRADPDVEIESLIVPAVIARHDAHVAQGGTHP